MQNKNPLIKPVIIAYSHIVGLALIRALGRRGVPIVVLHYLNSEMGYVSRYVKKHYRIAHPGKNEKAFLEDLHRIGEFYPGALLLPTDDYTLVAISKNKEDLVRQFIVGTGEWEMVSRIVKKEAIYSFAESIGISCPKTYTVRSRTDAFKAAELLGFPLLLKPCDGHVFYDLFRAKMLQINSEKELDVNFDQLQQNGIEVMVQEIIPGGDDQGVNYNSYFINGVPVAEFTAQKVRIDPPRFGSPRVLVSKKIPEIIGPGRTLLKALGYNGFSCMEFKRDIRNGEFHLMEINPRANLSGSLAVACGIDFPWIAYRNLVDGVTETSNDFREGISWIDLTKDVWHFFHSRKVEHYTIRQYIRPYLNKKVFAILSASDPLPFIWRCLAPIRKKIGSL